MEKHQYQFHAFGHKNVLGTHKTTLEFTKDKEVSLRGDCIIGVGADFDWEDIRKIILNRKQIKMTLKWPGGSDSVIFEPNPNFSSNHELVVRKTDFISERTLGIKADKASFELDNGLKRYLSNETGRIAVILENMPFK